MQPTIETHRAELAALCRRFHVRKLDLFGSAARDDFDPAVGVGTMLVDIVEVRPLGGHRLFLRFEDGTGGEIDLAPILRFDGIFEPLRDPVFFAQVRLERDLGTIVWPNGADLCPDVLHQRVIGGALPGQPPASRVVHG
jgi:predicted nucleotidyltransferase